ncbi:MAG: trypsin-like peptidase domain-containing protein [Burkholderiales bacterium]|nr:trypsin-like peptidase domain-containing protein [Burkholderiales bacterium]
MSKRHLCLLLAGALTLVALAPAARAAGAVPAAASAQPTSLAAAFRRGAAWAVGIYMFVPGEEEPRVGAGFLLDDQGAIATVAHLLSDEQQILVALPDKRLLAATLEGQDATADVALLRVSPPPRAHPVFASPDSLSVGDWVLAVGEPFGLERSASAGIVSGKDRHFGDDGELLFIQSDVALNPGNSGGPLLDASGAIAGMSARTIVGPAGTPGASLAIPIAIVRQIVAELRSDATLPRRPRLGALFDDVAPSVARAAGRGDISGALILSVPHGSLAERLQLRAGDIVTLMNGHPVTGSADLVNALLAWRSIAGTRMVVHRAGQELQLRLE